jgi:5-methylcytosine-specific restriction endonuclease McrA
VTRSRRPFSRPHYDKEDARARRAKLRQQLFDQQGGLCHICGLPMELIQRGRGTKRFATFDHVLPAALGGTAYWTNLRLAHGRCNSARGTKQITAASRSTTPSSAAAPQGTPPDGS